MISESRTDEELLYLDTQSRLRRWISDNRLAPGHWLPSERNLAKTMGVSRETLRRALTCLRHDNVIELRGRRGHRVRGRAEPAADPLSTAVKPTDRQTIRQTTPAAGRKTRRLGITVWGNEAFSHNPAMNRMLRGFQEACERRGALMEMVVVPTGRLIDRDWRDLLGGDSGRDGLATTAHFPPETLTYLAGSDFPMVYLNQCGLLPDVAEDLAGAMRQTMRHLAGLGHKNIVYLSGPSHFHMRQAAEVFVAESGALGMADARQAISWGYYTSYEGERQTRMFLESRRPTAIIAGDGYLARGALVALRAAGLDCPRDVSLAALSDFWGDEGVDGLALTAADLRHELVGRRAAEILLDWNDGVRPAPRSETAPFRFNPRGSTGMAIVKGNPRCD